MIVEMMKHSEFVKYYLHLQVGIFFLMICILSFICSDRRICYVCFLLLEMYVVYASTIVKDLVGTQGLLGVESADYIYLVTRA